MTGWLRAHRITAISTRPGRALSPAAIRSPRSESRSARPITCRMATPSPSSSALTPPVRRPWRQRVRKLPITAARRPILAISGSRPGLSTTWSGISRPPGTATPGVTYWWSGGPTITTSDQVQALVLGYDRVLQANRTGATSYNQMQPGAPYNGYYVTAWQAFTAQGNTITTLGVTVGSPGYTGSGSTVRIRLCGDPNCNTAYGETDPPIVNFGNSQGDIGDVSVTPGTTYYIVYYQPAAWSGHTWITYWWSGGPTIQQSDHIQAIVQGYDRSTPVPPTFHVAGTGGIGLTERSGPGLTYPLAAPEACRRPADPDQLPAAKRQRGGRLRHLGPAGQRQLGQRFLHDHSRLCRIPPGIRQCSSPPPPPPVNTSYRVDTGGLGLNERTGPGLAFPGVGALRPAARSTSPANGAAAVMRTDPRSGISSATAPGSPTGTSPRRKSTSSPPASRSADRPRPHPRTPTPSRRATACEARPPMAAIPPALPRTRSTR